MTILLGKRQSSIAPLPRCPLAQGLCVLQARETLAGTWSIVSCPKPCSQSPTQLDPHRKYRLIHKIGPVVVQRKFASSFAQKAASILNAHIEASWKVRKIRSPTSSCRTGWGILSVCRLGSLTEAAPRPPTGRGFPSSRHLRPWRLQSS